MNTNARLDALEARFDRLEALLVASLDAKAPAKTVRTKKPAQPKADPKPGTGKALTKATRRAFIAACAKDGYDCEGWSTWELAYWAISIGYAPKGFYVGERYAEMAVEAGALR